MLLIICHPQDESAIWLYRNLKHLTGEVEITTIDELVYARNITHHISSFSDDIVIELFDGRIFKSDELTGIINRVHSLPLKHLERVNAKDRSYATEEMNAFWLSLLDSFECPVLNPPTPQNLAGSWIHSTTVMQMAASVKLPVSLYRIDTTTGADKPAEASPPISSVVVYRERIYGQPAAQPLQEGCLLLSLQLEIPLLQVDFSYTDPDNPQFAGAHGSVDFRIGGQPLLEALVQTFFPMEAIP